MLATKGGPSAKCVMHRVLLFSIGLAICVTESRAELRAGAAVVRITPDQPMPMAGYYSTRLSTNTHDELYARALVMEQGGVRAAFVVCDLISLPRTVVEESRTILGRITQVPAANVMISATHSHTGPVLDTGTSRQAADAADMGIVRQYTAGLPTKIAAAVRLAEAALQPALLSVAKVREEHLSHNRRFHMRDGTVGWNPGKLNTNIVRTAGPIDPEVSVLYFASRPGRPIATFVNFAMHPDTVGGLEFSADYVFALTRLLAEYKSANMVTLFANGACGDINHIDVRWPGAQKGHAEAARLGTILAGNVLKAYPKLEPVTGAVLRVRSELVELPLPSVQAHDVDAATRVVGRIGTKSPPKFLEQVHAFKVLDVAARHGRPHTVEIQVIAFGKDLAWVSLPGEIFVELGLQIKRESPFRHTVIAELANGAIGYIPTARAYDEGNYEPVSARCARGSGEILVRTAVKLLKDAYGD
jgi:neutral ceramidase